MIELTNLFKYKNFSFQICKILFFLRTMNSTVIMRWTEKHLKLFNGKVYSGSVVAEEVVLPSLFSDSIFFNKSASTNSFMLSQPVGMKFGSMCFSKKWKVCTQMLVSDLQQRCVSNQWLLKSLRAYKDASSRWVWAVYSGQLHGVNVINLNLPFILKKKKKGVNKAAQNVWIFSCNRL